jgi:hypothetical protein
MSTNNNFMASLAEALLFNQPVGRVFDAYGHKFEVKKSDSTEQQIEDSDLQQGESETGSDTIQEAG